MTNQIKLVVLGDGTVGKTSLLIRFARDEFPEGYVPTVFENYAVTIPIGDQNYQLNMFDTAGQEEYDKVRETAFLNVQVILVCFSINLWSSFTNVKEKWVPELQKLSPETPFMVVGTKIDLRNDRETIEKLGKDGKTPISKQQGEKLAKELNAIKYMECSALTRENVSAVLQEAIKIVLYPDSSDHTSSTRCCTCITQNCILS